VTGLKRYGVSLLRHLHLGIWAIIGQSGKIAGILDKRKGIFDIVAQNWKFEAD